MGVKKLAKGVKYRLKESTSFCHIISSKFGMEFDLDSYGGTVDAVYVGTVAVEHGPRHIFYFQVDGGVSTYVMCDIDHSNYVLGLSSTFAQAEIAQALSDTNVKQN